MDEAADIKIELDREVFFRIGRALSRGIGTRLLGDVVLRVSGATLAIESDWGGGEIDCAGGADVTARVTAKAFCQKIRSRKQDELRGTMTLVFRRTLKEVAIDRIGVRAKFQ